MTRRMSLTSAAGKLAALGKGDRLYLESTGENLTRDMVRILPHFSRRPVEMFRRRFKQSFWTCVCKREVRYIICTERVK